MSDKNFENRGSEEKSFGGQDFGKRSRMQNSETRNSDTQWFSQIEDLGRADLASPDIKGGGEIPKNVAKHEKPHAEPSVAASVARLKKSLKSALKKATHSRPADYKKLADQVKQFQAVSFDVFDTALIRRCGEPRAIFDIVAQSCDVPDFARRRIEAEERARKIHAKHTNLEHIYECLELPLEESDGTREAMRMILKEMELNAERSNLTAKPEILRLYSQAAESGIRVAFISDMYLPSEFLRKALVSAGYEGLKSGGFAASGSAAGTASAESEQSQFVIVSCEEGKEKTDGGLFKAAIEKHGWTKNSLHIGDSIRHDLIGARRAGIKSCLINRY